MTKEVKNEKKARLWNMTINGHTLAYCAEQLDISPSAASIWMEDLIASDRKTIFIESKKSTSYTNEMKYGAHKLPVFGYWGSDEVVGER